MDIGPIGQRDLLRRNHRRRNAFYYRGGLHPDTVDWLARVAAVGGSVSGSTIAAVDQFARSIDAAGIRSRFLRLNLFCGNTLTTALVPFYRGPTTGAALGNPTDVNVNFVAADYTETGTGAGLQPNGSKRLQTGLSSSLLTSTDTHIWFASQQTVASGNNCDVGNGAANRMVLIVRFQSSGGANDDSFYRSKGVNLGIESYAIATAHEIGHILGTRTGASAAALYRNGAALTTTGTFSGSDAADGNFAIFDAAESGTADATRRRGSGYSIGRGMTAGDAASFWAATQAFATALGRPTS